MTLILPFNAGSNSNTFPFSKRHNGSVDATDGLELRNVSGTNLPLDNWQLTLQTNGGTVAIPFPTGTAIPA